MDTLYQQIVTALKKRIADGELRPNDRIPTELALSSEFGVSRITSARAVRELENCGMVRRIRGKGSFVTDVSQWLTGDARSRLISLIVPFSKQTGAGYVLLNGMEEQAKSRRNLISLHNSQESIDNERQIVEDVLGHNVMGIVLFPCSCFANLSVLSALVVRRFPVVLIDREVYGLDADFVGPANFDDMRAMVRHLVALGHRRIALMANTRRAVKSEHDRFLGYCAGLTEAGIAVRDEFLFFADEREESHHIVEWEQVGRNLTAGVEAVDYFMSNRPAPTAVMAVNDLGAAVLLQAAAHRGIRVPEDLSITGFDDLPVAAHLEVPLTTMAQPFFEIGATAVRLVHERAADPQRPVRRIEIASTLKPRASTRAV